jgi:menaquinone-specific isochorismate synthase
MVVTFKGRPFDGGPVDRGTVDRGIVDRGIVDRGTVLLSRPASAEMHQLQALVLQVRAALAQRPQEPALLSIQFDFPMADLLALWESLSPQETPYAYWEQPQPSLRILAVGQVVKIQTRGPQRFYQAQTELQRWQRSMLSLSAGGMGQPVTTPPWLASFTFFDESGDGFNNSEGVNIGADPFRAPFAPGWIWLPRWQLCRWPDRCELWVHSRLTPGCFRVEGGSDGIEAVVRSAWGLFQHLKYRLPHEHSHPSRHFTAPFFSPLAPSALQIDRFGRGVEAILEGMEGGHLQKVVLAHHLEVQVQSPFNVRQSLQNLRCYYPDCYLFCWANAQGTNFMGASPERLLRLHQQHLQTEALAGSVPRGSTPQESRHFAQGLLTNPKERHEHQLVVDFIVEQLQTLGIYPQRSGLPKVRQLSHIQHLHTDITATLTPQLHPLEVLAQLHPTPAVAGVPRDLACDYIRRYEPCDRSLYAAPLGWIDGSGNCEFIVGIRSALIHHDRARLMAGAGIVQGSVPQREIAEVELKLQTMLRSLA